ncbi:MAG: hypothetical protein ACRENP_07450 [Longimicrobiales bacterium]
MTWLDSVVVYNRTSGSGYIEDRGERLSLRGSFQQRHPHLVTTSADS